MEVVLHILFLMLPQVVFTLHVTLQKSKFLYNKTDCLPIMIGSLFYYIVIISVYLISFYSFFPATEIFFISTDGEPNAEAPSAGLNSRSVPIAAISMSNV